MDSSDPPASLYDWRARLSSRRRAKKVRAILRPVIRSLRCDLWEHHDPPFQQWSAALAWITDEVQEATAITDLEQYQELAHLCQELSKKTGVRWTLKREGARIRFPDGDRKHQWEVRSDSPLGEVTGKLRSMEELFGIERGLLWKALLLDHWPPKLNPVVIEEVTRAPSLPGGESIVVHSVQITVLEPTLRVVDFKGLSAAVGRSWGESGGDSRLLVVLAVDRNGGLPEAGFKWGKQKPFWEKICQELDATGVLHRDGKPYQWRGAMEAYFRLRPDDMKVARASPSATPES